MSIYTLAIKNYDSWENDLGPVWRAICSDKDNNRIIIDIQDERIAPRMYIRKIDFDLVMEVCKENDIWELVTHYDLDFPLKSQYNEDSVILYTKYQRDIRKIRGVIDGLITFQADVAWDKMVVHELQLTEFIDITDYDPLSFIPLDNIKPSNIEFPVTYNICYWDIETNNMAATTLNNAFLEADKIIIITYVVLCKDKKLYTYYGWKLEWIPGEHMEKHMTDLSDEILSSMKFKGYEKEWPVIVKKFNNEKDMHAQFLTDFSEDLYDGLYTFNGRGGNRKVRGRRQWYNGYDLPLFYYRCQYLGLHKEIQKLSPFPIMEQYGRLRNPAVFPRITYKENTSEIDKCEIHMKGMPHHDLLFDDDVLFYTKDDHEMKRHRLNDYMKHALQIEKVGHPGLMVWELFETDEELEKEYNIVDVEGMYGLDLYYGHTEDVAMSAMFYCGKIEDSVYTSKIHDHINLYTAAHRYLLETRGNRRYNVWKGLLNGKKVGGYNLPVESGVYGFFKKETGYILDFSSLYPNSHRSVNAGIMTKIELDHLSFKKEGLYLVDTFGNEFCWNDCARSPVGFFRKDIISADNEIYKNLNDKRDALKHLLAEYEIKREAATDPVEKEYYDTMAKIMFAKQYSLKARIINGKFGDTGYEASRSYDPVVYATPPSMGQVLIKLCIAKVKEWKEDKVIFASTDSAMCVTTIEDPVKCYDHAKNVCKRLNEEVIAPFMYDEFNCLENYNNLDIEKIFNCCVMLNKRYYMLNVVIKEERGEVILMDKPKIYVKGMEIVRNDAAMITYTAQTKLLDMIRFRSSIEEIKQYLIKLDTEFVSLPWDQMCSRAGIRMEVHEGSGSKYDACRRANDIISKQYGSGSNPLYGEFAVHPHTFKGAYTGTGVLKMAFDDEDEKWLRKCGFDLDYNELKRKHLYDKLKTILMLLTGEDYEAFIRKEANPSDW